MNTKLELYRDGSEWFAELREGELTSTQKAALTDWLRESPTHVRELLKHTLIHQELAALRLTPGQIDAWVQEARSAVHKPIPLRATGSTGTAPAPGVSGLSHSKVNPTYSPPGDNAATPGAGITKGVKRWAIAACLGLALLGAGALLLWQQGRYATGLGEQKILTLADGSVVTLNTSTTLKVEFSEGKRALRLLEGEAFFRVAHDPARPFEVSAQGATVKALGTQFNVRIASTATVVSVLDGAVEVRDHHVPKRVQGRPRVEPVVRLAKGEEARVAREPLDPPKQQRIAILKPERATVSRAAAWTQGRVEFEDAPLAQVLSEFQRYREFSVEIEAPLRELKLTGSFDARDPESAFAYVATLPGILVERPTAQHFVVRKVNDDSRPGAAGD